MEYIDYLQTAGYLLPEVEDLDLEDLQGAQGLKALRVTVNLQAAPAQEQTLPEIAHAALKAVPKVVNLNYGGSCPAYV